MYQLLNSTFVCASKNSTNYLLPKLEIPSLSHLFVVPPGLRLTWTEEMIPKQ